MVLEDVAPLMPFTLEESRRHREKHPEKWKAARRRYLIRKRLGLTRPRRQRECFTGPIAIGYAPRSFPIGINLVELAMINHLMLAEDVFWDLRRDSSL